MVGREFRGDAQPLGPGAADEGGALAGGEVLEVEGRVRRESAPDGERYLPLD